MAREKWRALLTRLKVEQLELWEFDDPLPIAPAACRKVGTPKPWS